MFDFGIIGGGVSGMYASILLAQKGYSVALIEANDRVGKKLLATGNGKCNLSNVLINEDCYNTEKALDIVNGFDMPVKMLELGLVTKVKSGRLYPYSGQSNNVLNVLLCNMERYGVKVYTNNPVNDVVINDNCITIIGTKDKIKCDKVCFATGSIASFGVENNSLLHKVFGKINPYMPSLAPLLVKCTEQIKGLYGVRQEANVSLYNGNNLIGTEFGEVQFRKDGVSGIVMMNMCARMCWNNMQKGECYLDFMPDYSVEQVEEFLQDKIVAEYGLVNKYLMQNALKYGACGIKKYRLDLTRCEDSKLAQVMHGGINLDVINLNNMTFKDNKKVYAIGESVDVDGLCGGYNLHWAFASAYNMAKEFGYVTKTK